MKVEVHYMCLCCEQLTLHVSSYTKGFCKRVAPKWSLSVAHTMVLCGLSQASSITCWHLLCSIIKHLDNTEQLTHATTSVHFCISLHTFNRGILVPVVGQDNNACCVSLYKRVWGQAKWHSSLSSIPGYYC